jgi:PAS domain-containing protein
MMILRRRGFWLLAVTGFLSVLGLGILAYRMLIVHLNFKTEAESVLFVALLLAGGILLITSVLLVHSRRALRRAESLFSQRSTFAADPEKWVNRLGPLGELFLGYNKEIITLNTRRAMKIFGLSSLVRILLNISDEPIAILDVRGEICYLSPAFCKKLDASYGELFGENISSVLDGIRIPHIVAEISRTHAPVSGSGGGRQVHFTPVLGKRGEIAYLLCTLAGRSIEVKAFPVEDSETEESGVTPKSKQKNLWSLASRLLGSFGRK